MASPLQGRGYGALAVWPRRSGEGFDGAALAPTVDHFTISNVNETVAPTLSSPGAIGVDFSDASIARAIMGMG